MGKADVFPRLQWFLIYSERWIFAMVPASGRRLVSSGLVSGRMARYSIAVGTAWDQEIAGFHMDVNGSGDAK
jgi:hypothetical protein